MDSKATSCNDTRISATWLRNGRMYTDPSGTCIKTENEVNNWGWTPGLVGMDRCWVVRYALIAFGAVQVDRPKGLLGEFGQFLLDSGVPCMAHG